MSELQRDEHGRLYRDAWPMMPGPFGIPADEAFVLGGCPVYLPTDIFASICPYCRSLHSLDRCPSCGAPRRAANPSDFG